MQSRGGVFLFRGFSKKTKSRLATGIISLIIVTFVGSLLYTGIRLGSRHPVEGEGSAIAIVNGQPISRVDFENLYRNTLLAQREQGATISLDMYGPIRSAVLDQMITRSLLNDAARRDRIKVPAKEVRAKLDEQKKQFASEKEFNAALARAGITVPQLTQAIREQLTLDALIEKVKGKAVVSDEAVAKAYQEKYKKEPEGPEFDKAKEGLRKELLTEAQAKELDRWFRDLKAKADIKVNDRQIEGFMNLQKGDIDKAIASFQSAVNGDPENAEYHLNLGLAYERKNDLDSAIRNYEQAVKLAPDDPYVHFYLGEAYRRTGKPDLAAAELKKASDLSYTDMLLHFRIQSAYRAMGRDADVKAETSKIQEIQKILERMQGSSSGQAPSSNASQSPSSNSTSSPSPASSPSSSTGRK